MTGENHEKFCGAALEYDEEDFVLPNTETCVWRIFKRAADVVLASLLLVLLCVPMLLLAVWVRCDSYGPAIFKQRRLGRGLHPFTIYKFRTMTLNAPRSVPSTVLSREDRERVLTRAGRFLRRSSLDELPQLWNVFLGSMSLVGPRPVIPEEAELHAFRAVFGATGVRPGITGLAQISGRDDTDLRTKAYLDAVYARRLSVRLDALIMAQTVRTVLGGEGWN